MPLDAALDTPLESLDLNEDSQLLVERAHRGDEEQNTLSEIYTQMKDSLFRLHVIDHATPVQPSPIISLTVENTLTFEELKAVVFPHVAGYNGDPNNYRFRRSVLVDQSIKQSNNQTIKQSNNQTIKQSNNQTIKQSNNQTIKQTRVILIVLKDLDLQGRKGR